ncbi:multicopper oxidase domain-containing protein [Pseudactinotalea sp. Z1739]|uniref:multicopper oxidase domain-containing protein n=1 Tax=Pseudactinotalea sp. Z1739 TaxID=3413028 RepID=UPI003C7E1532
MRTTTSPPQAGASTTRGVWAMRDRPALLWLVVAVIMAIAHPFVPESRWLMVHLVLLGAATHSIMVWSVYFAQALLKTPTELDDRRRQSRRLATLLVGVTMVMVGVPTTIWPLTVAGAVLVVTAVVAHFLALWRRLRHALPGRMRITVHYYLAAAVFLPVGALFGVMLARGYADPLHGQLLLAHSMLNVLGWVGLTVTGTLITLWPTMLRTRMDERAERLAKRALPVFGAALVVVLTGALAGVLAVVGAGLLAYVLALVWWGRALVRPARTRPPREFAPASVAAAMIWAVVGLGWLTLNTMMSSTWGELTAGFGPVVAVIVAGFAAQLLTGAMSYLIPVVLGGGPVAVRTTQWWFNRAGAARLVLINLGLVIFLLPVPSAVRVTTSVVTLAGLAWFIPLMLGAIRARRALREEQEAAAADAGSVERTESTVAVSREYARGPFWRGGQFVGAITALAVATAVGVGMDPAAAGLGTPAGTAGTGAAEDVVPTGRTTTVQVVADDMRFSPDHIEVPVGNRLVIELINEDTSDVHDLILGSEQTPRLATGESATLEAGVISGSLEGWCTIVGHRQMGMVLTVSAVGADGTPVPADQAGPEGDDDDVAAAGGHGHAGHRGGQGDTDGPRPSILPDAAEVTGFVDPGLPPLDTDAGTVHELTLTAQEVELEVAPGVWQRRWTFNGQVPGPTVHGRVGDVFEITLVNDGTIGHSIDFHAGSLAPDEPMRTIAPGESLVYRFTAGMAGIWLYHCGTDPMTSHIGAGMFGAVIIEPDDLEPVDRNYVLVQSEAYLRASGHGRGNAAEVDADRARAGSADAVAFNGIAFQYRQQPLPARVGERVRFWVLNAGPNRGSSFHIVGSQFDTVFHEGGYHLNRGVDAFGDTGGGSQALSVAVAQGGFVETVFGEAGNYPMVSHVMADAERGASGIVTVTE